MSKTPDTNEYLPRIEQTEDVVANGQHLHTSTPLSVNGKDMPRRLTVQLSTVYYNLVSVHKRTQDIFPPCRKFIDKSNIASNRTLLTAACPRDR